MNIPTSTAALRSTVGRSPTPVSSDDAARRVDPETFATIVDRDRLVSLALATRVCRSRALAEEVVQDALLAAWRDRERYDPLRGSTRSWLLAIVHHRAIDALRREQRRHGRDISDDAAMIRIAGTDCPATETQSRDMAARVRCAIEQIPAEQRHAIELSYFAGLSHTEIAHALDLAPGTVKGRIRLGLAKLRGLPEFALVA